MKIRTVIATKQGREIPRQDCMRSSTNILRIRTAEIEFSLEIGNHYCPAPSRGKNNKYIERNAKRTKLIVADLKFFSFFGLILRQFSVTEDKHEPGTNGFQPDLAIHFLRRFLHLCATPRWQQKHSTVLMLGTVSGDGFRSTDLSRKSARQ